MPAAAAASIMPRNATRSEMRNLHFQIFIGSFRSSAEYYALRADGHFAHRLDQRITQFLPARRLVATRAVFRTRRSPSAGTASPHADRSMSVGGRIFRASLSAQALLRRTDCLYVQFDQPRYAQRRRPNAQEFRRDRKMGYRRGHAAAGWRATHAGSVFHAYCDGTAIVIREGLLRLQ